MRKVIIVSLGQTDERQLTLQALDALTQSPGVFLRTHKHGVAKYLDRIGVSYQTLDDLYAACDDFDVLNEMAAERILGYNGPEPLCYGVFDATDDETVSALMRTGNADITFVPGVTQTADFLAAAGLQAECGLRTLPAITARHIMPDPRQSFLITELNSRSLTGEVKLKLLSLYKPETNAYFMHHGYVKPLSLEDIDRQPEYDHTSRVFIPPVPITQRDRYDFQDLVNIMTRLLGDDGCPWDLKQTHESLRQYLIEEAYETVAAIDQKDISHIYDELGDVLLQVVFHAVIAQKHNEFDIGDITGAITGKMISRHRHIFGNACCLSPDEVLESWEAIKKTEKGIETYAGLMNDIPSSLPALMRASKVQAKAEKAGFDFQTAQDALQKVYEEADELESTFQPCDMPDEEMGDLLFACVNVARKLKLQPELCLTSATDKFISRFTRMENEILLDGKTLEGLTLQEMDVYWERQKSARNS